MRFRGFVHAAPIVGAALFMAAAGASAAVITYSTDAPDTGFDGASLTLDNVSGVAATLTFIPNVNIATGVPSNINFGNFTLVCPTCTTQAGQGRSKAKRSLPHSLRWRKLMDLPNPPSN